MPTAFGWSPPNLPSLTFQERVAFNSLTNFISLGVWLPWAPVVTQGGDVAITAGQAEYTVAYGICEAHFGLQILGTGTAGNTLFVSPPVPMFAPSVGAVAGDVIIVDSGAPVVYTGVATISSNGIAFMRAVGSTGNYWGVDPSVAIDVNDTVTGSIRYRVA